MRVSASLSGSTKEDALAYLIAGDAPLFIYKDFPPSTALLEPPRLLDLSLFSSLPSY